MLLTLDERASIIALAMKRKFGNGAVRRMRNRLY